MPAIARKKTLQAISDAEEARIQAGIAKDPDNPEITEAEFAQMRPAAEVLPAALLASLKRQRGRPKAAETKQEVKLRLDRQAVSAFKATGPGWQTRMNAVLVRAAATLATSAGSADPARRPDKAPTGKAKPSAKR